MILMHDRVMVRLRYTVRFSYVVVVVWQNNLIESLDH